MTDLRPFTPADADAFAALQLAALGRAGNGEDLLAADARRSPADLLRRRMLVSADGEVLGGTQLQTWAFSPPGFLHAQVMVHPDARGQGHGRALWQDLLAAAQQAGARGLHADVPDPDPADRDWAVRRGFTVHAHRFASQLDLTRFDPAAFEPQRQAAQAQGVTFTDLSGTDLNSADGITLDRYLNFVADRLTETPDLAGHPRWPLTRVREILRLDHDPRPDWLVLALGPDGEWLGTSAMIRFRSLPFAYNELTALHPQARGRGLALPLKLQVIERARREGFTTMRTNNHSLNAPMLAVNRRLGFAQQAGRFEMHRPLP
ncbi:GNAT family N-acetyltransferase [Deinococcus seoulensis]|uniref:GNAT family N-acetyltransferase n=1 Tax=Deinococcus seoulensis TaxID=1837379 RepID=A0ABQ2RYC8_9DEIO|nr:GNAT family N-acetyltransferase [Deinococcus seoulensis]GGR72772.1 GNAT family N-acetyltransferase [Deinococcus seoulensis]